MSDVYYIGKSSGMFKPLLPSGIAEKQIAGEATDVRIIYKDGTTKDFDIGRAP